MTSSKVRDGKHSRFSSFLEEKARELVNNTEKKPLGFSIATLLEQELALTVEQIDRLRELNKRQLKSLLQAECYTDTEMMQMEQRMSRYSPERFRERDKFHTRLLAIEAERRKHSAVYEQQIQGLQRQMLGLMQKHQQLQVRDSFENPQRQRP